MTTLFDDFKNAFRKNDNGLIQLILINVIVFVIIKVIWVIATISESRFVYAYLTNILSIPAPIGEFITKPWSLITYFFTHEGLFHILFNMLFLYWFGMIIKEYLGNRRLINVYILGGLAGGALYLLIYNLIPFYSNQAGNVAMIGASAAVYAIVVAAPTLIPSYTFNLLLLGPVRIIYIAAFYIFVSFINTVGPNAGGNIAHLGGALIGFLYVQQLRKGNDLGRPISYTLEKISGLFTRKPKIKVTYNNRTAGKPARPGSKKPNQDEIDAILDKISVSGYESLSKEEKQKLFSASQKD
jgi:membrane associated rhomboid family serine protease